MATGGKQTESLASIKCDSDEKSRQIFKIDLKIQEFSHSGRDTADLEEVFVVDLQIRYELQKAKNRKKKKN